MIANIRNKIVKCVIWGKEEEHSGIGNKEIEIPEVKRVKMVSLWRKGLKLEEQSFSLQLDCCGLLALLCDLTF